METIRFIRLIAHARRRKRRMKGRTEKRAVKWIENH
jgi:hypothetical protein